MVAPKFDAVLYCNAANAILTWIPRLRGTPVAINVDGAGTESQEVEPRRQGVVPDVGMARDLDAESDRDRCPRN